MIFVAMVSLAGIALALPNFMSQSQRDALWPDASTVNLGLDLRGGSHLLLEVDFSKYLSEQLESLRDEVRARLREKDIGYVGLSIKGEAISFSLRNSADTEAARTAIKGVDVRLDISDSEGQITVQYAESMLQEMRHQVIGQSIEIVRRRVDETGTREPTIQRQGDLRIVLQVPGLDDPGKLKALLGKTAKMTFHLVDETVAASAGSNAPAGVLLLPYDESTNGGSEPSQRLAVNRRAILSGDMLVDSSPSYDEQGRPVVNFRFNAQGARKFGDTTAQHVGERFAIVLDDKVISAPVMREPIRGGSGMISGNFTVESAYDLALLLRAGALPAPLKVIEERTVGPSLGQDSIEAGKLASLLGIVLVMFFMVLVYGLFGFFSNLALIMNMVFILAALSLFQATLTLPGIAGIVLTIGMAVDANVLIFERIREEVKLGKTVWNAVDTGFKRAFHTIFDSNITTLIAALLLYYFGSGTVKGFAVTLSIGIIASMFSAILLTRMMVVVWMKRVRPSKLPI